MAIDVRGKGQRGEREAAALLTLWALPVTMAAGVDDISFERNLIQSRCGGYDVVGLEWLALEVKRHENLQVPAWWRQTLRQAGPGQVPFLMWRQNRTAWRFRLKLPATHCGYVVDWGMVLDLDLENAKTWFQHELWFRLRGPGDSAIME